MKRASKTIRDEIKAEKQRVLNQVTAAVFPEEMQTPGMKELVEKVIKAVDKQDGSEKNINSLTEEEALKVKGKLGSALPALRRLLKDAPKKLPHDPGGRKRKFSGEQQEEIIIEIMSLIRQGRELRAAKESVARKRGVSVSTIQRIWKQRELLLRKS